MAPLPGSHPPDPAGVETSSVRNGLLEPHARAPEEPSKALGYLIGAAVFLAALVLTWAFWDSSRQAGQRELDAYFDYRSRIAVRRIEDRLRHYEQVLLGARGLFGANALVTREGFAVFVSSFDLEKQYPGIQGVGFSVLVPPADLARHLAQIRGQGFPDYRLRPEGDREVYTAIIFLEPFRDRNLRAFGYDMFAEATRREAMRRAWDSGLTSMSGMVRLVQETEADVQAGFLLYVPVYRGGRQPASLEERRRDLLGWVYEPFRMHDLMRGLLGEGSGDLDIEILDTHETGEAVLMFDSASAHSAHALAKLEATQNLVFGGRTWRIVTRALPPLQARLGRDSAGQVLVLGGIASLLLGLLAHSLVERFARTRRQNASLERRVAERTLELQRSEEKFRTVADHTSDWEVWEDTGGRIIYSSPSCEGITGYPREAFLANPRLKESLLHPEDLGRWKAHRLHVHECPAGSPVAAEPTRDLDFRILRRDGEVRWIAHLCHEIFDGEGRPMGRRISDRDITERKKIEEALQEASEYARNLIETSLDPLVTISTEGKITDANTATEKITGQSRERLIGSDFADYFTDPEQARAGYVQAFASGQVTDYPLALRHRSGRITEVLYNASVYRNAAGEILGVFAAARDINERRKIETALRDSENRYRRITEGLTDYLYRVRLEDGRAISTTHSQGCETVTGYSPEDFAAEPFLWFRMIAPEDRELAKARVERILAGEEIEPFEHRIDRKDGVRRWVIDTIILNKDESGRLLSYDGVVEDITERRRAEEQQRQLEAQLHQSQKMESLGILAGGVAHDMNNVLGAILGLASVHVEIQPPDSPTHRAFVTITKACLRGGQLIRSLLGFARQELAEDKQLDLNALVREEVRLLERTTLARVRLEMDLAPDLRPVRGDASALTHVLMNLCVNAVDAMPENGTLTLRTRNADSWVEVRVEDTGCGMSPEVLEKAMDPFFTTKEQGKGTGLGLSIAHSTVMAHHGRMEIHSEPGRGTQVLLAFPACEPEAPIHQEPLTAQRRAFGVSLKVLLVDDDELIQSSMLGILEILGHSPTAATSGEECLSRLEAGFEPDLVILDMNMPGLGGAGTLPRLRALRPTLPVLLATGRVDQTALDLVASHPHVTLLSKPFGMKELQHMLQPLGRSALV